MHRRAFLQWLGAAAGIVLVAPSLVIAPALKAIESTVVIGGLGCPFEVGALLLFEGGEVAQIVRVTQAGCELSRNYYNFDSGATLPRSTQLLFANARPTD